MAISDTRLSGFKNTICREKRKLSLSGLYSTKSGPSLMFAVVCPPSVKFELYLQSISTNSIESLYHKCMD